MAFANAIGNLFRKATIDLRQQEEIEFVRDRVLRKFPLLGTYMAHLKTVAAEVANVQGIKEENGKKIPVIVKEKIDTAATDGKTIYFNPKYFETLSDDEKVFVYAHEVMHVAFNHILRSGKRDKELWNRATDAVINQMLMSEGLPLAKDGVNIAEALHHSAEEMYEKLLQEKNNKPDNQNQDGKGDKSDDQQSGGASSEGKNDQTGHDNHDIWDEIVKRHEWEKEQERENQKSRPKPQHGQGEPSQESDDSNQNGDKPEPQDNKSDKNKPHKPDGDKNQDQNVGEGGQRNFDNWSPANESEFEKGFEVHNRRERAAQGEQARKQLSIEKNRVMADQAVDVRSFGEVGKANAVMDWKRVLKKTLEAEQDKWSYRRSDEDNDYMARVEEMDDDEKSETEVLLDTSGSVSDEFLREFLRQLKPLLENSKMKVGCFDHRFHPFVEVKTDKDIDNYKIPDKGNTDWDLAVKSFTPKNQINKIVFTDGETPGLMPDESTRGINVIWLVYGNEEFSPVCGKVIRVAQKQIAQNYVLGFAAAQKQADRC